LDENGIYNFIYIYFIHEKDVSRCYGCFGEFLVISFFLCILLMHGKPGFDLFVHCTPTHMYTHIIFDSNWLVAHCIITQCKG